MSDTPDLTPREERRAARAKRRAFASGPLTPFVKAMQACMNSYRKARSEGVSREDGIKGIEMELRAAWPKSVSKFAPNCQSCDDTGWEEQRCFDQHRCGRKWCADAHPAQEHLYVTPCHCAKGRTHETRIATVEDQLAKVGRMAKKKSGFSRV